MKTSKYVFGLIFFLMGIFGCSDDESENIENVRETLIGSTWIQHSCLFKNSSEFEEYGCKDEYEFYNNGEFRVTGLVGIPELFQDTVKIVGNWKYDFENRIIEFTDVMIMVNELVFSDREKLKVIKINKDSFIAKPIYDQWEGSVIQEKYIRKIE